MKNEKTGASVNRRDLLKGNGSGAGRSGSAWQGFRRARRTRRHMSQSCSTPMTGKLFAC